MSLEAAGVIESSGADAMHIEKAVTALLVAAGGQRDGNAVSAGHPYHPARPMSSQRSLFFKVPAAFWTFIAASGQDCEIMQGDGVRETADEARKSSGRLPYNHTVKPNSLAKSPRSRPRRSSSR